LKPKLADAAAHAINRGVIFSGIASVENQLLEWARFEFESLSA
jgi:hypothetical protein